MTKSIAIIVNTSDNFEDCWNPFFKLFSKYWKDCNLPIYLNTELKTYSYTGLSIVSTQVQKENPLKRLSWSNCLIKALYKIDSEFILYFQEDYFLDAVVKTEVVEKALKVMSEDKSIKRIGLVSTDIMGEMTKSEYPDFWDVSQNARYRITTQVSIWRKETLLSYLRPEENGWMFEIYGTWRSRHRNERFLTISRELYTGSNSVFSYLHTGIIKGKWHPLVPELFKRHDIELDYKIRGFYDINISSFKRRFDTLKKLIKKPVFLIKAIIESL